MTTAFWIYNDLAAFCISLMLTGIIIPQILLIAFRRNLFDEVDQRKIHNGVVPRLGGIAFLPSLIFSICLVLAVNMGVHPDAVSTMISGLGQGLLYLMCAEMLIFLVGIADDLVDVRYTAKFLVQILCAVFICAAGAHIHDLGGILGIHDIPSWAGWIISGFIVVYIVNAINLIDGIDGLASGLSGIALVFYGIILTLSHQWILAMIAWAQLGTLVPFFYYNVFGNPQKRKKIFMGDTGALTLGLLMVFIALSITNIDSPEIPHHYNPIVLAFSPLVIPAFDVVRVYLHRVRLHRNPFLPDKCHIHHKLLALGISQRVSLCIILAASIAFMIINMVLSPHVSATMLLIADAAIWIGINILITHLIRRKEDRIQVSLYE